MLRRTLLAAFTCALPVAAQAASSPWYPTDGGQVRLVVEDRAPQGGILKGVLEIDLHDGWKTYWRDPGDAGIPPQIDIGASTNVSAATIRFPAPRRFDEGYGAWAGYKGAVRLPVEFAIPDPASFSVIEADIFLGVCEEICVPVQARLSVTQPTQHDDATVDAAFAALPDPASETLHVSEMADRGEKLLARAPGTQAPAELFVVTPPGWTLGVPEITSEAGAPTFSIPVLARPESAGPSPAFDYTLVAGDRAVNGTVALK